jgi:hypothetical protein
MVSRILEAGMASMLFLTAVFFLHASGIAGALLAGEAVLTNEYKAKNALLALQNFRSTDPLLSEKTIAELVHLGYLTGDDRYFRQAERDILYYLPKVLGSEWRVYTRDGKVDVESPRFRTSRTRGSAQAEVLGATVLVAVVGV